eukprot:m.79149 g.79149  ORF g.79149 m.79149 type:complete len:258 (-) comp10779_c0_seq2:183-956(-)
MIVWPESSLVSVRHLVIFVVEIFLECASFPIDPVRFHFSSSRALLTMTAPRIWKLVGLAVIVALFPTEIDADCTVVVPRAGDETCRSGCHCTYTFGVGALPRVTIERGAHAVLNCAGSQSCGLNSVITSHGTAKVKCTGTDSCTQGHFTGSGITVECGYDSMACNQAVCSGDVTLTGCQPDAMGWSQSCWYAHGCHIHTANVADAAAGPATKPSADNNTAYYIAGGVMCSVAIIVALFVVRTRHNSKYDPVVQTTDV